MNDLKLPPHVESALREAEKKDTRLYHPGHDSITGGMLETMFLEQCAFWWNINKQDKFYKFIQPCKHERYRAGDSWCEELGVSRNTFGRVRDRLGRQLDVANGEWWIGVFDEANKKNEPLFVVWYTAQDHLTWYMFNVTAYLKMRLMAYSERDVTIKKFISRIPKWDSESPKMGFGESQNGISLTETPTETPTESTAGQKTYPATPPKRQERPLVQEKEDDELDDYFGPSSRAVNSNGDQPPGSPDEAKARIAGALAGWQISQDGLDPREATAMERLDDSGWTPRPERMAWQVAMFMAWTHFQDAPATDSGRKAWYKALKEHQQWSPDLCRDLYQEADKILYPMRRDRPADWRPPGGPWGYTKTMAGLAADRQEGGASGYTPPGIDLAAYQQKLSEDR